MPLTLEQRHHIVSLRQSGRTNAQVTAHMLEIFGIQVQRRTVQKVFSKYKETGTVENRPRSGRPPKCDPRAGRSLRRDALRNRWASIRSLTYSFNITQGAQVSRETARRVLKKYGLVRHISKRRPALTLAQRRRRLAFARRYNNWRICNWGRVLFTDEKIFRASSNRRHEFVTRFSFEKYNPNCISRVSKGGPQVHVWGAMGWRGVAPLIRIRGTLTALEYQQQVLTGIQGIARQVAGFGRRRGPHAWVLQQDNAPAHAARATRQYLDDNHIEVLDWPPNSPDLNPIENLWGYVVHRMSREPVHSEVELFARVEAAWATIPNSVIRKLMRSVPNRIREVLVNHGHPTRY